jgi:hypothetical protein
MGAATYPTDGRSEEQILSLADRRMYWHKREFYHLRALRDDTGLPGPELQEGRPKVESPRRSHA